MNHAILRERFLKLRPARKPVQNEPKLAAVFVDVAETAQSVS
jgi:hypothetical protein